MRKLSKYEKETIINWNEAENLASIYTFNASLKRRLADFSRKYPLLCRLERSTPEGSVTYVLDKSRLSIRLVPPYSEERKAAASAYAKEHGFQVVGAEEKSPEIGAITAKCRVCTRHFDRQSPQAYSVSTPRLWAQMCGYGAGETGKHRSCGGSQLRLREYRGQPALCAGVQGRQRTAGVKGQRPLAG